MQLSANPDLSRLFFVALMPTGVPMKTPNVARKPNGQGITAAKRHIEKAFEGLHNALASKMPRPKIRTRMAELAAPIIREAEAQLQHAHLRHRDKSILVIREVTETPEELFAQALTSLNALTGGRRRRLDFWSLSAISRCCFSLGFILFCGLLSQR